MFVEHLCIFDQSAHTLKLDMVLTASNGQGEVCTPERNTVYWATEEEVQLIR